MTGHWKSDDFSAQSPIMQGMPTPIHHKGAVTMPTLKLGAKRQIVLPKEITERLHLEPGEELEAYTTDKAVVLVPRKHIPKDQRWYYTDEWQQMMQEAFEDLKAGRMLGPFESVQEFKQAVDARAHRS
jgi:AbrB family looped-hinge helix DNA binding protein